MRKAVVVSNLAVSIKLRLTVWEFIILVTLSLSAVICVSDTVIEDRFDVEHGSEEWYKKLGLHFKWLLHHRINPYFSSNNNYNLWQPLNMEHFDSVSKMASENFAYADARVLTT
ncbi:hypothetical protein ARALYDRAFT_902189 [Arabidopsis lyrata subsp. lyrata]|uniref:Uncharacterized protein n=1 Tax=Arabidopsis lyrata subsp. lyrata TaxID=81972 RepID=D7LDM1_ARALL|nr:hypothetical protein ARALYDRAFT_902189 [Arabidopsis lyrata subsp. lyrata]